MQIEKVSTRISKESSYQSCRLTMTYTSVNTSLRIE